MIDQVKERLQSLGYNVLDGDEYGIHFAIKSSEQYIKHFCNICEVPTCLEHVLIDMASGDFLMSKQSIGQLSSMQIEPIVKRLTDGDTTVEYNVTIDREATFNAFLDKMIHGHDSELMAHRCLRW